MSRINIGPAVAGPAVPAPAPLFMDKNELLEQQFRASVTSSEIGTTSVQWTKDISYLEVHYTCSYMNMLALNVYIQSCICLN